MARTQKNKATSGHLGMLKAKLAKLRRDLLDPTKGPGAGGGGGGGDGFDVNKVGDARVGFVGFPSVGKSTLLTKLTGTHSEAAAYEFTTLTAVPGIVRYRGAKIQMLDLPGIIEGAKDGKGRGRQVISTARTCNLILIVLDCLKPLTHKKLIEHGELSFFLFLGVFCCCFCLGRVFFSFLSLTEENNNELPLPPKQNQNQNNRARVLRHPPQQEAPQHHLQEEGARRHQLHRQPGRARAQGGRRGGESRFR
jgi:hypothetical protein